MIKSSFLDYYKMILDKVSFDPVLFQKEYRKAQRVLSDTEVKQLDHWLRVKELQRKFGPVQMSQKPRSRKFNVSV